MKISNPELEVVRFNADDVIATSALLGKSASFYIGNDIDGYQEFYGKFTSYDNGVYGITRLGDLSTVDSNDRNELMNGSDGLDLGVGYIIPGFPTGETIAKQYYDATLEGGSYYSSGLNYYEQYWNQ